ncbi:cadherin-like protein 26 isoform X2 [Hyperolius riggenbachi]|uniref:cadherin-like protein 26 isoform X2 n=1 Tax=Hyperolius riggenbachi TaxID=752182 RepID=UPI0035A3817E
MERTLLLGILVLLAGFLEGHQGRASSNATSRHKGHSRHRHKRDWIIDTFSLQEELPGPYPKLIGTVNLEEGAQLMYKLQGKGVDEDPIGLFHIDEDNGSIFVHGKVDFEKTPLFQWKFNAINKTDKKVGTRLGIHLRIIDINDNAPEFKAKTFYVSVNESTIQGNTIFTMLAYDKDEESSPNSVVSYFIKSQTPDDPNVQFIIDEKKGFISFKGCLNYETNKNYKLAVEGRDNGEKIQQSSSCEVHVTVLDRNTNPPVWSSPSLTGEVPEHAVNVTILRFGVTDRDTPHTSGWRAVYTIVEGDDDENYNIITDPKTNEGMLVVVKALDYEEMTKSLLRIRASNEEALYSCKVVKKTTTGLWTIETNNGQASSAKMETILATVNILDVNDAPIFKPDTILVSLEEHSIDIDNVLATVEAKDPDIVAPNKIKYHLENDTGDWLSINEDTGVITTKKHLDRESDHVIQSKYIVRVLAVDDGNPAMTGTATLIIKLKDINDNAPSLRSAYLTTCENDQDAHLEIPIIDKDLDPYSGPFFVNVLDKDHDKKPIKLLNHDNDIIKVKKEKTAQQGNHTLHLEIYDRQGVVSHQNLTLYVCDCLGGHACVEKLTAPPTLSGGAIALLLLTPLLLLLLLILLVCQIKRHLLIPLESDPANSIMVYNEEGGSKDCEASAFITSLGNAADSANHEEIDGNFHRSSTRVYAGSHGAALQASGLMRSLSMQHGASRMAVGAGFDRANRRRHSSYHRERRHQNFDRAASLRHSASVRQYRSGASSSLTMQRKHLKTLEAALLQRLNAEKKETEMYKPRVFAEEGELSKASSLESISIAGSNLNLSTLQSFGSKFDILEGICEEHMTVTKTSFKT